MKFCIITHVVHTEVNHKFYGYAPYVNEMNIWLKNVDEVVIVAPKENFSLSPIHQAYNHASIEFVEVKKFDALTFSAKLKAIITVIKNCVLIYKAMKNADHIHLRCPGNIGLLGCIIQLFFPKKQKTAKYAGNWDPKSKQPLSYRFQKWIISSTFFTKNMQVLVYGEWENQTKNIKPFFTATYSENQKQTVAMRHFSSPLKFLFVGTLSSGKQPLYAINLVQKLIENNKECTLEIFGEGIEITKLEHYIKENKLEEIVFLRGNQSLETIKMAYCKSHFVILPSKSEGWPKVIAEAMFWGCLPIASKVSCLPSMLNNGERGILLEMNLNQDISQIVELIDNEANYLEKTSNAMHWSRKYTTDFFESEIKTLLQVY
jgi:glycosyltransferase involved in cell wall biosynthesis